MSKDVDPRDIFINEELLIELARRELKGRLPPQPPTEPRLNPAAAGRKNKLAREIEGRGWTPRDLAKAIGVTAMEANALVRGGQRISPEIAGKLASAFATSSEYWLSDDE